MRVWLADLQPHTQEPSLELLGQPRARSEATDEECNLFPEDQEQNLTISRCTNRTGSKVLTEVVPNGVSASYPVSVSLPALIPHLGSLSLGEPNLTH